jgi:hypothetical protein
MMTLLLIGCGTLVVLLGSLAAGGLLFRHLRLALPWHEALALWFLSGSALFSTVWFVFGVCGWVSPTIAVAVSVTLVVLALLSRVWTMLGPLPATYSCRLLAYASVLFVPYCAIYLLYALRPEASPDGSYYHNGFLTLYADVHRIVPVPDSLYAALGQGIEIQALPGFLIGKHCVPGLLQVVYLIALAVLMVGVSVRAGLAKAGVAAAFLVFAAPLVGYGATQALNDVSVAAVVFGMFACLCLHVASNDYRLVVPAGLLAGFAVATKYSAVPATAVLTVYLVWAMLLRRRLPWRWAMVSLTLAAAMILPYLLRNAIWYGNPLAPFQNAWFPNPNFSPWQEWEYREPLRTYGWLGAGGYWWQIPGEVTLNGVRLQGLYGVGPFLVPFGLLGLRNSLSRAALATGAMLSIAFPENIGARFLMPAIPFLALFLAIAVSRWPGMLPVLLLIHGISSWPSVLARWSEPGAMQLGPIPSISEVVRTIPEGESLKKRLPAYDAARWFEKNVARGDRIFAYSTFPEAYTVHHACVAYESTHCYKLSDVFLSGLWDRYRPDRQVVFAFQPKPIAALRLEQVAAKSGRLDIRELRLYSEGKEVLYDGRWEVRSSANPEDLQYLFDRRLVTGWSPWENFRPGQFVELRFPEETPIDRIEIRITSAESQPEFRVLGGRRPAGSNVIAWTPVAARRTEQVVPIPTDLRRQVSEELYRRGVRFVFAMRSDFFSNELMSSQAEWAIVAAAQSPDWVVFELLEPAGAAISR